MGLTFFSFSTPFLSFASPLSFRFSWGPQRIDCFQIKTTSLTLTCISPPPPLSTKCFNHFKTKKSQLNRSSLCFHCQKWIYISNLPPKGVWSCSTPSISCTSASWSSSPVGQVSPPSLYNNPDRLHQYSHHPHFPPPLLSSLNSQILDTDTLVIGTKISCTAQRKGDFVPRTSYDVYTRANVDKEPLFQAYLTWGP